MRKCPVCDYFCEESLFENDYCKQICQNCLKMEEEIEIEDHMVDSVVAEREKNP